MIFRTTRLLWQAIRTIGLQREAIAALEQEKLMVELAYMRISRDLMEQFLIALDQPEYQDDVRENLTNAIGFYRDEIAVREEHV